MVEMPQVPRTGVPKTTDTSRVENAPASRPGATKDAGAVSDSVSLSSRARLLQHLRARYDELPDVRKEKVETLKERIKEGTYKLDNEEIVRSILTGSLFREE
ncbi:MAG: flagellar biosynthesis anti-sigma factor FlgM [bacterium]